MFFKLSSKQADQTKNDQVYVGTSHLDTYQQYLNQEYTFVNGKTHTHIDVLVGFNSQEGYAMWFMACKRHDDVIRIKKAEEETK